VRACARASRRRRARGVSRRWVWELVGPASPRSGVPGRMAEDQRVARSTTDRCEARRVWEWARSATPWSWTSGDRAPTRRVPRGPTRGGRAPPRASTAGTAAVFAHASRAPLSSVVIPQIPLPPGREGTPCAPPGSSRFWDNFTIAGTHGRAGGSPHEEYVGASSPSALASDGAVIIRLGVISGCDGRPWTGSYPRSPLRSRWAPRHRRGRWCARRPSGPRTDALCFTWGGVGHSAIRRPRSLWDLPLRALWYPGRARPGRAVESGHPARGGARSHGHGSSAGVRRARGRARSARRRDVRGGPSVAPGGDRARRPALAASDRAPEPTASRQPCRTTKRKCCGSGSETSIS
jgi:hypothetical protein